MSRFHRLLFWGWFPQPRGSYCGICGQRCPTIFWLPIQESLPDV
jgi:hypothetical protein